MLVSRCARQGLTVLVAIVVTACGGATTGSTASPSIPDATATSASPASAAPSSTAVAASPSASPSAAARAAGQIVWTDSGQDFQHSQIWLEEADGSNVRQVVKDAYTDNEPSLSPDGRQIVFARQFTEDITPAIKDPSLFGAIMIVNVDGSDLHEVMTGNREHLCDTAPEGDAWSPDGKRIAFVQVCFDRKVNFVGGGIWTINADGTDARQVTKITAADQIEDHRVGWSPDGKSLTFNRIDDATSPERNAVFTIGVDGKNLYQVTPWSVDANDPDWSPDGSLIAFSASAEPSPTQNIYTVRPDGTGLTELTTYNLKNQATFPPTWSPDGSQILFSHSPSTDGWGDFFEMNGDGTNQHVVAHTAAHENQGQWGPDPAP
jgi:TolB protein